MPHAGQAAPAFAAQPCNWTGRCSYHACVAGGSDVSCGSVQEPTGLALRSMGFQYWQRKAPERASRSAEPRLAGPRGRLLLVIAASGVARESGWWELWAAPSDDLGPRARAAPRFCTANCCPTTARHRKARQRSDIGRLRALPPSDPRTHPFWFYPDPSIPISTLNGGQPGRPALSCPAPAEAGHARPRRLGVTHTPGDQPANETGPDVPGRDRGAAMREVSTGSAPPEPRRFVMDVRRAGCLRRLGGRRPRLAARCPRRP